VLAVFWRLGAWGWSFVKQFLVGVFCFSQVLSCVVNFLVGECSVGSVGVPLDGVIVSHLFFQGRKIIR